MSIEQKKRVYEAANSALFQNGFTFLGEDSRGAWWRRGDRRETSVRVNVQQKVLVDEVHATIEWHNVSLPGRNISGTKTFEIGCTSMETETQVALKAAIRGIFQVYLDVVSGTGVASAEALKDLEF